MRDGGLRIGQLTDGVRVAVQRKTGAPGTSAAAANV